MSDYTVTRRSFLGAALAAIPTTGLVGITSEDASPIEFVVGFMDSETITIILHPDKTMFAYFRGQPMVMEYGGFFKRFWYESGEYTATIRLCAIESDSIEVDYFYVTEPLVPKSS